jgi:predicted CopG family antitoxin
MSLRFTPKGTHQYIERRFTIYPKLFQNNFHSTGRQYGYVSEGLNVELYYFFHLVSLVARLKAIKISEETYAKLAEVAGELQVKLKRPVSLDEAMKYLLEHKEKRKGAKITDLAGSWDMSDEEWVEIRTSLAEVWKRWKPPETRL